MSTYSVFGVEEVYDAFDEYEHANAVPPFAVYADSLDEAKAKGVEAIWQYIKWTREGFFSSGEFVPRVIQIADESGRLVFNDPQQLVRTWPFSSDETSLIPSNGLPTRVCFISYNSRDEGFARSLHNQLLKFRYLTWFAPERLDMPRRRFVEEQLIKSRIADGIRAARIVLVAISEHSLASSWVAFEVLTAIESEKLRKRPAIIGLQIAPVASEGQWLSELRIRHSIRDFSQWQNSVWFREQAEDLARDMNAIFESRSQ